MNHRARTGLRGASLICAVVVLTVTPLSAWAETVYRTLPVGQQTREYYLHVPPSYTGTEPVPLVLMLHGGYGNGLQFERSSGFSAKADKEGFIIVYPNAAGTPRAWNTGWSPATGAVTPAEELAFFTALLDTLEAEFWIDTARVFVGGHSSGACMTHFLGGTLAHRFAAMAPYAGTVGGIYRDLGYAQALFPETPVSAMIVHGLLDDRVPFDGGVSDYWPWYIMPVWYSAVFWIAVDGCYFEPETTYPPGGEIRIDTFRKGAGGTEVQLWILLEQGHSWPQLRNGSLTDAMWAFFASHPKQ